MTDKLKACPFCGGKATLWEDVGADRPFNILCGCGGRVGWFETEKEAVETWNKRTVAVYEKQIPKKPIEKDWVAFDVLQERDWFCPNCDENMLSYGQPYCSVCGQAIDWS